MNDHSSAPDLCADPYQAGNVSHSKEMVRRMQGSVSLCFPNL